MEKSINHARWNHYVAQNVAEVNQVGVPTCCFLTFGLVGLLLVGVASVVMLIILPVVPFVVSQPPPQIYRHPQRNEEMPYPVWSIDRSLSVTLGIQSYELSHQLEAIIERSRSGQMSGDGFILDKDGFFYIHYIVQWDYDCLVYCVYQNELKLVVPASERNVTKLSKGLPWDSLYEEVHSI